MRIISIRATKFTLSPLIHPLRGTKSITGHWDTLIRHILKVDKICNSAPCTLNKNKDKHYQTDQNAPMYIIMEPWMANSTLLLKSYPILPSPALRSHELATLATPLALGVGLSNCKLKKNASAKHSSCSRTLANFKMTQKKNGILDLNLRYRTEKRKSGAEKRRTLSRRLLILSITLGVCAAVLIIVIIIIWQVGKYRNKTYRD